MVRRLSPISESRLPRALVALFFLLLQSSLVSIFAFADVTQTHMPTMDRQCSETQQSGGATHQYRHLIVLVHGYMGSHREQEYLGEALLAESKRVLGDTAACQRRNHEFSILYSTANEKDSTDGVAVGGARLAAEISDWVREQTNDVGETASDSESTIMTLSVFGNSLGGVYGRYALANLGPLLDPDDGDQPTIRPLLFCTTSSPHLGLSRETFVELPKQIEPFAVRLLGLSGQRTMDDLFAHRDSTLVADMCHSSLYLAPLGRFRKRIAVANAYNTDFLVSVTSGAFLSADSDSVHHRRDSEFEGSESFRWMRDVEHVVLQVATLPDDKDGLLKGAGGVDIGNSDEDSNNSKENGDNHDNNLETTQICVDALDNLGWHKVFIDTRDLLPNFVNFDIPKLPPKASYSSRELQGHFKQYGTLLPVAHPLNMANAKTDWYRALTRKGQPIVDALAELLVLDMMELSEKHMDS